MDLHLTKDSVKMRRWFSFISTDVGCIKSNKKTYTFLLKSVCKGVPSLIVVPLVTQHGNRVLRHSKCRANNFKLTLACPACSLNIHTLAALKTDTITQQFPGLSEWVSVTCQNNQKLEWDFVGPMTLEVWWGLLSFTEWSVLSVPQQL